MLQEYKKLKLFSFLMCIPFIVLIGLNNVYLMEGSYTLHKYIIFMIPVLIGLFGLTILFFRKLIEIICDYTDSFITNYELKNFIKVHLKDTKFDFPIKYHYDDFESVIKEVKKNIDDIESILVTRCESCTLLAYRLYNSLDYTYLCVRNERYYAIDLACIFVLKMNKTVYVKELMYNVKEVFYKP